ncbi:MAG: YgcG family protein, partial [Betaproteobacteria bacterium]
MSAVCRAIVMAMGGLFAPALIGFAACASAAEAPEIPYLTGRVVDNAEILKPATRERLTATLKAHEQATGNQIAVLTTATIKGQSVEEYATKVFESWRLGQKPADNGVLVLVVPQDRKMRIEVGYGLEGTLTDVASSRIIRNVMTPRFKAGDYDQGIELGVAAIVAQLEGRGDAASSANVVSPAAESDSGSLHFNEPNLAWPERILLGAFIFGIIGLFTFVGIMTPGVGWFLYVFLIPFWAMFPLIIIGVRATMVLLGTYVIGYPIAKLILS